MRAKEKILTTLIGATLLLAILIPIKSNAALQANGSGASKDKVEQWMLKIRSMETSGETLGLDGNASLTGNVENSNNLDIHMQKNTEYGAMAILSASNYGKSMPVHITNDESLSTTTGNKSGVYISLNNEWVCAGSLGNVSTYTSANIKYKNPYSNSQSSKIGDATLETKGWHKTEGTAVTATWLNNSRAGLVRSCAGSIFSYTGYAWNNNYHYEYGGEIAYYSKSHASRAVVVIGEGF